MKTILVILLLLSVMTLPVIAELDDNDLNKIRLIVKEEIDPVKKDVAVMQGKLEGIDKRFEGIDKRFEGIDKRFDDVDGKINMLTYIVCALIALIGIAIIPQYIFLFRSNKIAEQDRKIEALTVEIETLKEQRIQAE